MLRLLSAWLSACLWLFAAKVSVAQPLSLIHVLPDQSRAFLLANDGALAAQLHLRAGDGAGAPDLSRNVGLNVKLLAESAKGELLRSEVALGGGRFAEVVVAQVAQGKGKALVADAARQLTAAGARARRVELDGSPAQVFRRGSGRNQKTVVYWTDDSTIVVSNNTVAAESVVKRIRAGASSPASQKFLVHDQIRLSPDPGQLAVSWFSDPWLGVDSDDSASASPYVGKWDLKAAQRHGLESIRSLSGVVVLDSKMIRATETMIQPTQPLKSSLRLAGSLRAGPLRFPDFVPDDVAEAVQLNADVPAAFADIGPLFDDLFAEGVEGTYSDVLEDLKSEDGLNIDLTKELYPHLGPRILIVLGDQGDKKYQPVVYAFETSKPDKCAKAVETLMRDDPDAKRLSLDGLSHPVWHVPPFEGGGGFSMMVGRGHAIYSNDLPLLKRVLAEQPSDSRLNQSPRVTKTAKQIATRSGQQPCAIAIRKTTGNAASGSPLQLLFAGQAAVPSDAEGQEQTSWFMEEIAPWIQSQQVVLGFAEGNGWRVLSQSADE